MKVSVFVKQTIDIQTISIDINPRYIGEEDGVPEDFPLLNHGHWGAVVNIDTGQIQNWTGCGKSWQLFTKVCDEGTYALYDSEGQQVACLEGHYVPNGIVPGEYGDYIHLQINENGIITNWSDSPDVSRFFED